MSTSSQNQSQSWTIARLLDWTKQHFQAKGVDEPLLAAEILLSHALNCKRIELYTRFDQEPDEKQRTTFRELVTRAAAHEPIAYLVGYREFYSLDFEVSPAVLIPRPETETLVAQAIEHFREKEQDTPQILDIGTGSGCIAISILTQLTNARGVATDVSPEALEIAHRNRHAHNLQDSLVLVEADSLDIPAEHCPEKGFDLIVSNPPYVTESDWLELHPCVKNYEPKLALTGGEEGLDLYRDFAVRSCNFLAASGSILMEIGYDQHSEIVNLFENQGRFEHTGTWRDAGDPHDRVVRFTLKG